MLLDVPRHLASVTLEGSLAPLTLGPSVSESVSSSRAEILLVEDNPGDARLIKAYLEEIREESGTSHLVHVTHLEEARHRLEEGHVDAVLLDLGLPDCEGLETLEALAAVGMEVPVVVLTGNPDEGLRRGASELGAIDYVLKDELDPERLARVLESALGHSRLVESMRKARKDAELAQAQLMELVVLSFEPAVILGPDRRVVYANPAAGALFGVDARRLRRQKLPLPIDRGQPSHVELSDVLGRTHDLEVRTMSVRWRDQPAYLVLMRPRDARGGRALERPTHYASVAMLASELHAHAHRLEAWIRQAEDHQRKLADLGRWIGRPSQGSGVTISRVESRRTMAELVDDTRDALGEASSDLERVRRLSTHLQRMSTHGRPVELQTLDSLVRQTCDSVGRDCPHELSLLVETAAPSVFPRDAARATNVLERLLNALVSIARQELTAPLQVAVRTRAHRDSALVLLDIDGPSSSPGFRARVLTGLVTAPTESAPELELAQCLGAIRDLGGHARFGTRADDSLWIELSVTQPQSS